MKKKIKKLKSGDKVWVSHLFSNGHRPQTYPAFRICKREFFGTVEADGKVFYRVGRHPDLAPAYPPSMVFRNRKDCILNLVHRIDRQIARFNFLRESAIVSLPGDGDLSIHVPAVID